MLVDNNRRNTIASCCTAAFRTSVLKLIFLYPFQLHNMHDSFVTLLTGRFIVTATEFACAFALVVWVGDC